MDLKEYESMIQTKKEAHKKELYALHKEYAFSNNPVQVGDIVSDTFGVLIVVNSVKWGFTAYRRDTPPECVYYGIKHTKSGKPFKNGDTDCVYQSKLKSINGGPFEKAAVN